MPRSSQCCNGRIQLRCDSDYNHQSDGGIVIERFDWHPFPEAHNYFSVGYEYYSGTNRASKDLKKATEYFRISSEKGDFGAKYNLIALILAEPGKLGTAEEAFDLLIELIIYNAPDTDKLVTFYLPKMSEKDQNTFKTKCNLNSIVDNKCLDGTVKKKKYEDLCKKYYESVKSNTSLVSTLFYLSEHYYAASFYMGCLFESMYQSNKNNDIFEKKAFAWFNKTREEGGTHYFKNGYPSKMKTTPPNIISNEDLVIIQECLEDTNTIILPPERIIEMIKNDPSSIPVSYVSSDKVSDGNN